MSSAVDTDRFFDIFQCIKEDPILLGDYNSARGTLLSIYFKKCVDEPGTLIAEKKCRPDDEILNWMAGRFIVTLENEIRFSTHTVEDTKLEKTSKLIWGTLSPQMRYE